MAVAGGATKAYDCQVRDGALHIVRDRTTLRDLCTKPEDAIEALARGQVVIVAGSDIAALRAALQERGVNAWSI